jgi:hypothetical protein
MNKVENLRATIDVGNSGVHSADGHAAGILEPLIVCTLGRATARVAGLQKTTGADGAGCDACAVPEVYELGGWGSGG